MIHAVRLPLVSLLLLALLGGCAGLRPDSSAGESRFVGLAGTGVYVWTDLPDAFAGPRGLRAPELRGRALARLEEARVPVARDLNETGPDGSYQLALVSAAVGPDDYAVWVRVSLGELVKPRRGSRNPLLVHTWTRSAAVRVRGDDTAPLWREIERLTREFAREYHAANPGRRAGPATGGATP